VSRLSKARKCGSKIRGGFRAENLTEGGGKSRGGKPRADLRIKHFSALQGVATGQNSPFAVPKDWPPQGCFSSPTSSLEEKELPVSSQSQGINWVREWSSCRRETGQKRKKGTSQTTEGRKKIEMPQKATDRSGLGGRG